MLSLDPLSCQPSTRPQSHQAPHEPQPVNTDRWYYRVFQSAPDLIRVERDEC